ncbi:MAG: class I SAM-dependent methyltransferase [Ignavibacteriae bacterium]|nr:MAG: class I SAM-dependent methyltransferase [Ignavibacteriota bacterium]
MKSDIRIDAARFYDLNPDFPKDVPFYQALIPSPEARILELGCGTGRVTISLFPFCRLIHGIDLSSAMVELCRLKVENANIPANKVIISEGSITDFSFNQRFDLIIAPFRVLQNLETDSEVEGFFRCIREHLTSEGTCILNVFKPSFSPDVLREQWVVPGERLNWEISTERGRVSCFDRRIRVDKEHLVIYPDLIYRRYQGRTITEEVVLHLAMRCYYPETFEKLIIEHGFEIVNRWGGYNGEKYGEGPELVLRFRLGA